MSMVELQPHSKRPRLFVVMGVAGCGKSSIGEALAIKLEGRFMDGDHFHPPSNIDKMSSGEPLTDEDRWPWLEIVAKEMAKHPGVVIAGCSALKRRYRDFITEKAGEPVLFLHLAGSKDLITKRMAARSGHFMPTSLLDSQFAALEIPAADENAISIDISGSREKVVAEILLRLTKQA